MPRSEHPGVDVSPGELGWASPSLEASLRTSLLLTVALAQVALVPVAVVDLGADAWPVVAGMGVLAAYAIAARRHRLAVWPVPALMAVLGLSMYLLSDGPDSAVVFAGAWTVNFASVIAGILIISRWVTPVVIACAALISACLLWQQTAWSIDFPLAIVVTQTTIMLVLRPGMAALRRSAARTDRAEAHAAQDLRRAEVSRSISRQVAEESRTIHDTAVNTLGAIAMRVATAENLTLVREQCERDVALLETLRARQSAADSPDRGLLAVLAQSRLPVVRSGLADEEIHAFEATLDPARAGAVTGCVREAVTNAHKHSGAQRLFVDVGLDGTTMRITVRDDGRGFDGRPRTGRGIEQSLLGRAEDHGLQASVDSAPGAGTTVTLVVSGSTSERPVIVSADIDSEVLRIHRFTSVMWGAGVTVVSVVLAAIGDRAAFSTLVPMVAVMAAAWLCVVAVRPGRDTWWLRVGLVVATVAVFTLSAAATDFGTQSPWRWHALAATGPFVLLLSYRPPRRYVLAAMAIWALHVLAVTAHASSGGSDAVAIVLMAGLVGIGFTLVWWRFQGLFSGMGAQTALLRRRAFEARVAIDAQLAAQTTYRRWVDAGLDDALTLLRGVAAGALDPTDERTRQACGDEESYLRQLVLVSPELVHLGHGIMPTFRQARDRGIELRLRLGGQDAPDAATARGICAAIVHAIEHTPPGGSLAVSVYPVAGGLQLTLSGPSLPFDGSDPLFPTVSRVRVGNGELLLLVFATPTPDDVLVP